MNGVKQSQDGRFCSCFLPIIAFACFGGLDVTLSQWSSPILLSKWLPGVAFSPSITIDKHNVPHVTWAQDIDNDKSHDEIFYTFSTHEWAEPQNISLSSTPSSQPLVLADSFERVHFLWGERIANVSQSPSQRPTDIYYRNLRNSIWSDPISIYHTDEAPFGIPKPSAVVDSDGSLLVAWKGSPLDLFINFRRMDSSGWQTIQKVRWGLMPSIAVEGDKVFLCYAFGAPSPGKPDVNSIFYTMSPDKGRTWSDSILIHRSGIQPGFFPRILLDKRNRYTHVLWLKDFDNNLSPDAVFHSWSRDGLQWETPINITQNLDPQHYWSFACAADPLGAIHLLFQGDGRIYYTRFKEMSWSNPRDINVTKHAQEIDAALDDLGVLHLVWRDYSTSPPGIYYSKSQVTTSVDREKDNPYAFFLFQNFPNPFNTSTTIRYTVPFDTHVTLDIVDLLGRPVVTLLSEHKRRGSYAITYRSGGLSSGVFFYKLTTPSYSAVRKFVVLK